MSIVNGNATNIPLADGAVQVCVTSPPYFGLRNYKTSPKIWGGSPDCTHEWGAEMIEHKRGKAGDMSTMEGPANRGRTQDAHQGNLCQLCGAWRGELGQEPTPQLFVDHLMLVTAEIWRVLRNDGTFWLNISDSYAGGKGASSQSWSTAHLNRTTLEKAQHQIAGKGETRVLDARDLGIKPKSLCGIPQRAILALMDQGWIIRNDIIWAKNSCMPESVTDRCTHSHEYIYMCVKQGNYYYDSVAVEEAAHYDGRKDTMMKGSKKYVDGLVPNQSAQTMQAHGHERWPRKYDDTGNGGDGSKIKDHNGNSLNNDRFTRNRRDVWRINPQPFSGSHFATFPPELPRTCILAGSKAGDLVLDPFAGSGTTLKVAIELGRRAFGVELSPAYIALSHDRMTVTRGMAL